MGPGDVEGLGRGGHHHQMLGDAVKCGHRHMDLTRHRQIMVNFVTDQHQIVAFGKGGDGAEFGAGPDPATGVVRRTEDDHRLAPGHLRVIGVEIHLVPAIHPDQRAFHHRAPCCFDHPGKSVIDRGEQHHPIAGGGEGIDTKCRAVDQPMGGEDRRRIDRPAVPFGHPPDDRGLVFSVIAKIAIDAMRRHRLQRMLNGGGGSEIHIGNPHGDAVHGRHAAERLHVVPFVAMGAAPVDRVVKAHADLLCGPRYPA